ncbi:capsid protein [Rhizorhabdus wittichii DC-6]|nr:capsid protein [Rhizorhabdus wittichii DC-6]
MSLSPFPIDPALSAIAVAYKNADYIADLVLPRIRVNKQEFKFMQYASDTFFNIPDTRVGRKSKPNEVDLKGEEVTDSTDDNGLDGGVPIADMENADERYDPLGLEIMLLQELIALAREKRAADRIFTAANYPSGLKQTLSGTSQFSHTSSTPIQTINDALDLPLMRPNQLVFGQAVWTKFRSHPQIVEACLGTAAKQGNVSRQQVAELFEVKEVLVGSARGNASKKGQTPSMTRLWGKQLAMLYKAPVPEAKDVVTFGGTFQWGDRIAGQWEDRNMGLRGGIAVRTGESVKERVIAQDAAYLFDAAIA